MMKMCGMKTKEFAEYFHVPVKTVENWVTSSASRRYRRCPEYLLELMEYKLRNEGLIKDQEELPEDSHTENDEGK